MAKVTWHGHSTCTLVTDGGKTIVIDPFFAENPSCAVSVADFDELDYILVTHGHFDHFADCVPLAQRTGATVVSTFEIAAFLQTQGIEHVHGMNIGGGYRFEGVGYVKMTPALHTGSVHGDVTGEHTSVAAGFLVDMDGKGFHHAGDTALTHDMDFLKGSVDVALLPIGDNFTMGPADAARAVELIGARVAIPIHYGTWDVIAQDPESFRRAVGDLARVEILEPGGSFTF